MLASCGVWQGWGIVGKVKVRSGCCGSGCLGRRGGNSIQGPAGVGHSHLLGPTDGPAANPGAFLWPGRVWGGRLVDLTGGTLEGQICGLD